MNKPYSLIILAEKDDEINSEITNDIRWLENTHKMGTPQKGWVRNQIRARHRESGNRRSWIPGQARNDNLEKSHVIIVLKSHFCAMPFFCLPVHQIFP